MIVSPIPITTLYGQTINEGNKDAIKIKEKKFNRVV